MSPNKVPILDVNVDSITMDEAVRRVETYMKLKQKSMIATANAEMIMRAGQDGELATILNQADLVVPDGAGTVWAARRLGYFMPERVAGYDLVQRLLSRAPESGAKVYFLGSAPGVALKAKAAAEQNYPGIRVVGARDGYFSQEQEQSVVDEINAASPVLLLVALGVPRQEKWIWRHKDDLKVSVMIGVGGTLDVMAGVVKRAPVWMQKAKLEWLYRGMLQPRRIGRLMALPRFVLKVRSCKKH